jgi:hypothetical protein
MIHVTDGAMDLLESVHQQLSDRTPEQVLRLEAMPDQKLGFVLGDAQTDDQVVERQGSDLLHIGSPLSDALDGGVIERVDTPEGPRFGFTMEPPADGAQSPS